MNFQQGTVYKQSHTFVNGFHLFVDSSDMGQTKSKISLLLYSYDTRPCKTKYQGWVREKSAWVGKKTKFKTLLYEYAVAEENNNNMIIRVSPYLYVLPKAEPSVLCIDLFNRNCTSQYFVQFPHRACRIAVQQYAHVG